MIRLGVNPLANTRQSNTDQAELSFLTREQTGQLFDECRRSTNGHSYPVALICLATGARWDEVESIARSAIFGATAHFHRTKNHQSRSVPIPKAVESSARGKVVDMADAQIAAIGRLHDAVIVTRNVRHFESLGVALIDPWNT